MQFTHEYVLFKVKVNNKKLRLSRLFYLCNQFSYKRTKSRFCWGKPRCLNNRQYLQDSNLNPYHPFDGA